MAFLSGAFGPTLHYPAFLRAIGDVLPLKYFIDIVNTVYLRGDAIWTKPWDLAALAAWGVGRPALRRVPVPLGADRLLARADG